MLKKVSALVLTFCLCFACFCLDTLADNADAVTTDFVQDEFVKCAENSLYELYVIGSGMRSGEFYIKNKADGICHYSNPQNREFDEYSLLDYDKESSQFLLQVYSEESGAIRTVNSFRGSSSGEGVTVTAEENGFDCDYLINEIIEITLKIRLTDKGFTAETKLDEVNTSAENITTNIQLLPYFETALYGQEGYSFVPDGSGAIIYNNTNKNTATKYSQKIYGEDLAFSSLNKTVNTQTAHMPVFGAKNKNGGYVAIIDKGAESAYVNAVSAYNQSMYNMVYSSFDIVGSDKINLGGNSSSGFTSATETYEYKVPLTDDVKISYLFLEKQDGYTQMAELYREHLGLKEGNVSDTPSVFLEIYGGHSRKESFLGIPLTVFKKLTTVKQAEKIIEFFEDSVEGDPIVSYRNIDSAIIAGKIQNKFRLKSSLGSKKELKALKETLNGKLYLENNIFSAKRSGNGFSVFSDVALRINRNNIKLEQFNLATTVLDKDKKAAYAVNSKELEKIYKKYFSSTKKAGYKSAFVNLANSAYSDFNKKNPISRKETIETFTELIKNNGANGLLYAPNAYALSYGEYISDTPIFSSGYDLIDEDIPFYQMVLSGVKEYSTVSLNLNTNTEVTFLKALESGASLKFTFVYGNITSIKNTEYEYLFGADFNNRKAQAAEYQQKLETAFQKLGSRVVKNHTVLKNGVRITEFENGSKVVINYSDIAVETEYGKVEPQNYIIITA